jgi:hypothetical protein
MSALQTALENFTYHRKRTLDLLESLSDANLLHTPDENQGPLWKQFRHLGRVHENYAEALDSRRVNFSKGKSYRDGAPKRALLRVRSESMRTLSSETRSSRSSATTARVAFVRARLAEVIK